MSTIGLLPRIAAEVDRPVLRKSRLSETHSPTVAVSLPFLKHSAENQSCQQQTTGYVVHILKLCEERLKRPSSVEFTWFHLHLFRGIYR